MSLFLVSGIYRGRIKHKEITVNHILDLQKIFKNDKRNKNKIINTLKLLSKKNIIKIECDGEIKGTTYLTISFPVLDTGFVKIDKNIIEQAQNEYELYMLCVLKKFSKRGVQKNIEGWAGLLDVSRRTVESIILDMKNRNIIHCKEGKIIKDKNTVKQEPNTYFLGSLFSGETKINKIEQHQLQENINHQQTENIDPVDIDIEKEEENHNWYNNKPLNVDDFVLYLTIKNKENKTKDEEELIKKAERKINNISKNEKGKYVIEKLKSEAEAIIRKREYEQKQMKLKRKEEEFIEKVKSAKKNIIKRGDDIFELEDVSDLQMSDRILFVVNEYKYEHGLEFEVERIKSLKVSDIIRGNIYEEYTNIIIYDSTVETLFNKLKEIMASKKIEWQDVKAIQELRNEIFKKNNENKRLDENHEGDELHFNGIKEVNLDLEERIRNNNNNIKDDEEENDLIIF